MTKCSEEKVVDASYPFVICGPPQLQIMAKPSAGTSGNAVTLACTAALADQVQLLVQQTNIVMAEKCISSAQLSRNYFTVEL